MSKDYAELRAEFESLSDAIESGYEFMLAYAAQGRRTDKGAAPDRSARSHLERMESALGDLGAGARKLAAARDAALPERCGAFFTALEADAATARAVIALVLAQADISSQLVDNLNASIHLRALLTDLFIVDEALKPPRPD